MALLDFITSKKPEDVERRLRLAQGIAGMAHSPNVGLQQSIAGRLQDVQAQRQKQAAKELADAQRNKTAQWLASQGRADLAQGILTGSLSGAQAFELFKQKPEDGRTALMKNYEYAINELNMKPENAATWAKAGGTVINMNPTIPAGYQGVYDEKGKLTRVEPIAGGPVEQAQEEAEAKKKASTETQLRTSGIVVEDISRLKDYIKDESVFSPVTGITGAVMSNIPASARRDAEELAKTIKGNIGFDRLQRMREESPTGGALGAINQQEMELLSTVLGSLNMNQSAQQLIANLDRLEKIYTSISSKAAAYPNAQTYGFSGTTQSADSSGVLVYNPETKQFEPEK